MTDFTAPQFCIGFDAAALTEARYLDWLAQRPVADERIAA